MNESPDISQSAARTLLNVTVSNLGPDIILCVPLDDIDLLTVPLLREKLTEVIDVAPRHLVIDLSEVQFLASIGLQLLLDLRAAQQAAGHQLALVVGNNRAVTRPLWVTGLDHYFDLYAELTTAVKACHVVETVREPGLDRIGEYETTVSAARRE